MTLLYKYLTLITLLHFSSLQLLQSQDIWFTHRINSKHLPVTFTTDNGKIIKIDKGIKVEILESKGNKWRISTLINNEKFSGAINKHSHLGEPILFIPNVLDRYISKDEKFCYEIFVTGNRVLTLRNRPLTDEELTEMLNDRLSEKSKKINSETALLGLQDGVDFELLDDEDETWNKIKVQSKNMEFIGFVNKYVDGIETQLNLCN